MAESTVDGVLIEGSKGEYHFIGAKDLEIYRLTDQEAVRTKELVGRGGLKDAAARMMHLATVSLCLPALFGPIGTVVKGLADDPTVSKVLRDDPTVGKLLNDDPTVSKVLRDDPTVAKKLRDDPTVSKVGSGAARRSDCIGTPGDSAVYGDRGSRKSYRRGTHRVVPPEETIARVGGSHARSGSPDLPTSPGSTLSGFRSPRRSGQTRGRCRCPRARA